jgi:signal peptidase I
VTEFSRSSPDAGVEGEPRHDPGAEPGRQPVRTTFVPPDHGTFIPPDDGYASPAQLPATGQTNGNGRAPSRRSGMPPGARAFFDWVVVVGVALLVAILVRTFLLAHFVVEGTSMYSTLDTGDRVFVNKLSYRLHDPNRGDVVVLHEITGASERDLIKRVIGLPGEVIEMDNCVVRIDGLVLQEPYLDPTVVTPGNCGENFAPRTVPEDNVFVMGDNRPGSQDSRALGPIPFHDLVGRAFVVFWPRSDWQWL